MVAIARSSAISQAWSAYNRSLEVRGGQAGEYRLNCRCVMFVCSPCPPPPPPGCFEALSSAPKVLRFMPERIKLRVRSS